MSVRLRLKSAYCDALKSSTSSAQITKNDAASLRRRRSIVLDNFKYKLDGFRDVEEAPGYNLLSRVWKMKPFQGESEVDSAIAFLLHLLLLK